MNELILSTTNAPAKFTFKNAKLNEISAKIAEQSAAMNSVYNAAKEGAEAVNKALAPLFGELMASKCYKDDGFKSVADYAEQTFGMSKSMAYMLARVGETFYNTGSADAKRARETLSTSKLAELTGVDKKDIGKALKEGKLAADTSLADCREFATAHKKPGKERVVTTFDLYAMNPAYDNGKKLIFEDILKEELAGRAGEFSGLANYASAKLEGDKASAAMHFLMFSESGICAMFEYRPHVSKNVGKRGKTAEPFDLNAYIANLSPAERLEVLKALDGTKE